MNGMIKTFYTDSDYRFLKDQAFVVFEEVSEGIYVVVKNRSDYLATIKLKTFSSSIQVVEVLNYCEKVVVAHKGGGSGYGNWNFELPKRNRRMM